MVYLLGNEVEISTERRCLRSDIDHSLLAREARASRIEHNFSDVDNDFVLCLRCGKGISLRIESISSLCQEDALALTS